MRTGHGDIVIGLQSRAKGTKLYFRLRHVKKYLHIVSAKAVSFSIQTSPPPFLCGLAFGRWRSSSSSLSAWAWRSLAFWESGLEVRL